MMQIDFTGSEKEGGLKYRHMFCIHLVPFERNGFVFPPLVRHYVPQEMVNIGSDPGNRLPSKQLLNKTVVGYSQKCVMSKI